jgi:hypothetical protein
MVTRARTIAVVLLALAGWVLPAQADIILMEDFDNLTVGTNPDDDNPAGGWQFPANYITDGASEGADRGIFTIVLTSSFDPDGTGNSLHVQSSDAVDNHHLANLLDQTIQGDTAVLARFDTYVPTGGGGGTMYLSGDNGGGGYSNASDRGPQVAFLTDGTVVAAGQDGSMIPLGSYTFDAWLTMEIRTSVASGTYDIYLGPRGGNLELLASDLAYRSPGVKFFDRYTFAHFAALAPSNQYFDEVWLLTRDRN